jgi:hypothetical protein
VGRLVHELVIAWKRLLTYPPGHRALEGAVAKAHRQLAGLLAASGSLAFGITREALLHGEQRIEGIGASQLAAILYGQNVAVLRFLDGIGEDELAALLSILKPPAGAGEAPSLLERLGTVSVPHVILEAADYSRVRATDSLAAVAAPRSAESLWERILNWQLKGRPAIEAPLEGGSLAEVLKLVTETAAASGGLPGPGGAAPPAVADLLRRLAEAIEAHLGERPAGAAGAASARQVAEFLAALPAPFAASVLDATLAKLVRPEAGAEPLADLAASASAVDLLRSLRRLKDQGLRFSAGAVRLIDALVPAAEAAREAAAAPPTPFEDLRLVLEEDLDAAVLARRPELALELPPPVPPGDPPEGLEEDLATLSQRSTLQGLLRAMLACLADPDLEEHGIDGALARIEAAFGTLLAVGHPNAAAALVLQVRDLAAPRAPAGPAAAARRLLERLAGGATVPVLLEAIRRSEPDELTQIRHLVGLLGPGLVRYLLSALSDAEDRSDRRALFDFLRSLPEAVVGEAPSLLADPRWFVVRNVISLLHTVGDRRSVPRIRECLAHQEPRVRIAAFEALTDLDRELPGDLVLQMLADPDERVARRAMVFAGARRVTAAVEPLLALLKPLDWGGRRRELRVQALRCLGQIGDPAVLPALSRHFSNFLALDHVEERRAAFLSLEGYPPEARRRWLRKGLRSRDPEIRTVASRLAAEDRDAP